MKDVPSLIRGNGKIACPTCLENNRAEHECIGRIGKEFKPFRQVERFKLDLVQVIQHDRNHGGCGHVFALGDAKVMIAFLEGRLIPREMYDELLAEHKALLAKHNNGQELTTEVTNS